jgi:hypothetical protein
MAKWRVYNVHPEGVTLKDKFRGEPVEIKAGDYVLMDYEDATMFKGNMIWGGIKLDAMSQQTADTKKMLRLQPHTEEDAIVTKEKFICQRDGKEFNSRAELDAYTKANFSEEVFKDDALEDKPKKKKTG